jgi:hypothetical protein
MKDGRVLPRLLAALICPIPGALPIVATALAVGWVVKRWNKPPTQGRNTLPPTDEPTKALRGASHTRSASCLGDPQLVTAPRPELHCSKQLEVKCSP